MKILKYLLYFVLFVLGVIGIVITVMAFCYLITPLQQKLFVKEEYLIYLVKSPYWYLIFLIMFLFTSRVISVLSSEDKLSSLKNMLCLKSKLDKGVLLSIILLTFLLITSTVVVTEEGIYDYSFYNLKGNKYSFGDIEKVNTGFIDSGRNKGEFFYNVEMKNGKEYNLGYPSLMQPSREYEGDSWQEYVVIDKLVMNSGAEKESSESGSNYVQMDQIYIDKLLSVIRNK